MSITLKDVAKLANVSASTVSRVLNDDPRISAEKKEIVMQCINTLGYKMNSIARSLRTNRTYTIGFITDDICGAFGMRVAKGVEEELKKQGYTVVICNTNGSVEEEESRIRVLVERCVDGIIIIPASNEGKHINQLKDLNVPVVLVDRLVDDFTADAVLVDNINGCYAAVEKLINTGYRRIGFIGGDLKYTTAKERYSGYCRALDDYRLAYNEEIVKFGDYHMDSGYILMKELCCSSNPPDSVVIANYNMCAGAIRFFAENKAEETPVMPIASFDDVEMISIHKNCTIRVAQPTMDIGKSAAEIILKRINSEELQFPQIVRLKTTLISR